MRTRIPDRQWRAAIETWRANSHLAYEEERLHRAVHAAVQNTPDRLPWGRILTRSALLMGIGWALIGSVLVAVWLIQHG